MLEQQLGVRAIVSLFTPKCHPATHSVQTAGWQRNIVFIDDQIPWPNAHSPCYQQQREVKRGEQLSLPHPCLSFRPRAKWRVGPGYLGAWSGVQPYSDHPDLAEEYLQPPRSPHLTYKKELVTLSYCLLTEHLYMKLWLARYQAGSLCGWIVMSRKTTKKKLRQTNRKNQLFSPLHPYTHRTQRLVWVPWCDSRNQASQYQIEAASWQRRADRMRAE